MSLFDQDSNVSSSASDSDEEGTLPPRPPPPPGSVSQRYAPSSGVGASLTPLEQRRRMAEQDAAARRPGLGLGGGAGRAQWRNELLQRPPPQPTAPSSAGGAAAAAAVSGGGTSKFGSSIAAALSLRRDEKEKTLLRRLQLQRAAEEQGSEGKALAQKDMEVGVFVTASYRAMLQRRIRPHGADDCDGGNGEPEQHKTAADAEHSKGDEDEEDDDGPLGAYLRQLEGHRLPSADAASPPHHDASDSSYYDRLMRAPLEEERREASTLTAAMPASDAAVAEDIPGIAPPSLAELQELIGGPETVGTTAALAEAVLPPKEESAPPRSADAERRGTAPAEEHSAVLAHARLVYDMREAARRRTANAATVETFAQRCDERIAATLFCP